MKVIIAGGREFTNYDFVEKECNSILKNLAEPIEIVSGLARGVDTLAINYQIKYGYKLHPFPADWDAFGLGAGHKRNGEMADFADMLIAFWDGRSTGTKNMIETMRKLNKPVHVIYYKSEDNIQWF